MIELLDPRLLFATSNALDRIDFGDLAAEAAHRFEVGVAPANLPVAGTGTVGASARTPSASPSATAGDTRCGRC